MSKTSKFKIKKGNTLPLGTQLINGGVNFSVSVPNASECRLNIYQNGKAKVYDTIVMDESYRVGNIFSIFIEDFNYREYEYTYEVMNKEFIDPYAYRVTGRNLWAKPVNNKGKKVHGGFYFDDFDWTGDIEHNRPYWNTIMYKTHLRGFTCSKTSKVNNRGTYTGFEEKIPYLVELGVNCVVLLPIYEFDEILIDKYLIRPENPTYMEYNALIAKREEYSKDPVIEHYVRAKTLEGVVPYKINYWGYGDDCNYFAPKASYAADPDNATNELKHLILELHKAGIEVILEFNFEYWTNKQLITDCLRFWKMEYHIDGFKINNNVVPLESIATDPVLGNSKLITDGWDINRIYKEEYVPVNKNLAEMNEGFLADVRRYLKGDEALTNNFAYRFRRNHLKHAVINYVSDVNGFTLNDVYSYDVKHNEENGESNRDGTDYNFSWNCGFEGPTRKLKVLQLRKKMVKNALLVTVFSQGTPMILGGDELLNSQKGNNNAYCQDNETSWINWNTNAANTEISEFLKKLIKIRNEHPILRMNEEFKIRDYVSCGYPDLSYHGTKAWFPDFSNYSRTLGVLLCGEYAVANKFGSRNGINSCLKANKKDDYFYMAFNMHWEPHQFDLPKLPEGMEWELIVDTHSEKNYEGKIIDGISFNVRERTIAVFKSKKSSINKKINKGKNVTGKK